MAVETSEFHVPPGYEDYPFEKKVAYVEWLQGKLLADSKGEYVPIPPWHIPLLEESIREADLHPEDSIPWEDAMERIRARMARRSQAR